MRSGLRSIQALQMKVTWGCTRNVYIEEAKEEYTLRNMRSNNRTGWQIRSLCSDNDSKIGKMMREEPQFRDIKHLLDFWHLVKGITHDLRRVRTTTH